MSTASLPALDVQRPQSGALWIRFTWKEYRMLRGFWLAILVLGVLEQWVSTLMMIETHVIPSWLFTSAWGAAALYAVGAAVTLFGAENEERTRGFLQLLPGRWQPMFFAKVAVAVGSSLLLAGLLCLTGWIIAGGEWPNASQRTLSLSVAGVAVVEATVWGLLFSLLWKQPLMAAVTAMAAASFGSQLAILATSTAMNLFSAESYQAAVPMRLAICLVVFAVDLLLGRRWLAPLGVQVKRRREKPAVDSVATAKPQAATSPWQRRMFARLLWQTWRESWGAILAATGLGLLLTVSCFVPATLLGPGDAFQHWKLLPLLILPALFGALVFRADQKQNHRLFLATHSALPRLVWLARQIVWLGALVVVLYVIRFSFWRIVPMETARQIASSLMDIGSNYEFRGGFYNASEWFQRWWQGQRMIANHRITWGTWSAVLAAYALGQFFSLAFKREVLAGFLAIILSIVLAAWSAVVLVWQLNSLWFVLPIGLGAILATWLRIPDWLVDRRNLRNWLAPALAIGFPILLVSMCLPAARLAQMDLPLPSFPYLQEPLEASLEVFGQRQKVRSKSALLLEHAQGNVAELVAVTQRPDFSAPLNEPENPTVLNRRAVACRLLGEEAQRLTSDGELEKAWQLLLAQVRLNASRIEEHLKYDQKVLDWAQSPQQTTEQLKSALVDLEKAFSELPQPRESILFDSLHTRDVILEKELPQFLNNGGNRVELHLAYLANKLPWERERALLALNYLTSQALNYVDALQRVSPDKIRDLWRTKPWSGTFALSRIAMCDNWKEFVRACNLTEASRTSYLTTVEFLDGNQLEFHLPEWFKEEAHRVAVLTQLALIAYRLDHGEYPKKLSELVPDYLTKTPVDPYSGKEFQYRSEGLEYPLIYDRDKELPAETPFFWSAGLGNPGLELVPYYVPIDEDAMNPGGYGGEGGGYGEFIAPPTDYIQPSEKGRTVYQFSGIVYHWDVPLLFPLPAEQ